MVKNTIAFALLMAISTSALVAGGGGEDWTGERLKLSVHHFVDGLDKGNNLATKVTSANQFLDEDSDGEGAKSIDYPRLSTMKVYGETHTGLKAWTARLCSKVLSIFLTF